jgi:archaellum component FlaC
MVFNISDKIEDLTKKVNKLESQYKGVDSTYVNPYGKDTTIIKKIKE